MPGVKSVSSNANDPYGIVQPVGNDNSVNAAEPIKEAKAPNIVEAESEQKLEKEKKAFQELAADKVIEEQMKAQIKKTDLTNQLDSSQSAEKIGSKDDAHQDPIDLYYKDPDGQQAVPWHRANGDLQRRNIADKKWE
jgi:hypothetical protein